MRQQVRLSPARIESILSAVERIRLGQSLTVRHLQRLLGLTAAASNVIPFGLLHMRPLQWWLRTKGFSPRGNPFRMIKVTQRCLCALVMWKKPWFLSQGPVLGASCHRKMLWSWLRLRLYAFPPIALLPGVLERVRQDWVPLLLIAPQWPGRVWFPDLLSLLDRPPLELPIRRYLLSQAGGSIFHPHPELWKLWALIDSGLSTKVFDTILHSRAPSMRKRYPLKWKVFTSRCSDYQLDPVNCPVGAVLEFLQDRFTAGLTPSTLKVYVAAISAYHIPLGGMSMGKDPLVSHFLRGTLRLRPAARTRCRHGTWPLSCKAFPWLPSSL